MKEEEDNEKCALGAKTRARLKLRYVLMTTTIITAITSYLLLLLLLYYYDC